jgi:PAS domain S-box-containing protein
MKREPTTGADGPAHPPAGPAADAEERYRRLMEDVPVGLYRSTPDGKIIEANPALCRMLGYSSPEAFLRSSAEAEYVDPDDRRRWRELIDRDGVVLDFETRLRRADGSVMWALDSARAVPDEAGEVVYYQGSMRDITQRKRVQEALLEAEEKYRMLVERLPGILYIAGFADTSYWHYLSPQVERFLGFTVDDFMSHPDLFTDRLHPEDRDRFLAAEKHSRLTGEPLSVEFRMYALDGRVVWFRDQAVIERDTDGTPLLMEGLMLDITERKLAEEELERSLQLLQRAMEERQLLLGRLVRAQEEERQRIAADIHDDPVQSMTAVGYRLYALAKELGEDRAEAVAEIERDISHAVQRLRTLMFELRPPALDRQGLAAALELFLGEAWLPRRLEERLVDNRIVHEPASEIRASLYRICQEAITNVAKHAGASRVEVLLEEADGGVRVRVADDGRGFRPTPDELPEPGHLGLTAMRERAELLGGTLNVKSAPGEGTVVEVWVPTPTDAPLDAPAGS